MAVDLSLDEARSSLAYWERRAQRLPRRAVRARREARAMAARWRERVTETERAAYGGGLLGLVLLLVLEGRMPESARHTSRRVARWTVRGALLAVAAFATVVVLSVVAAVALLVAVL